MKHFIVIILLIFCSMTILSGNCCYRILGITTSKSKKIVKPNIYQNRIKIKKLISKNSTTNPIFTLLKHTKVKKTSKDRTLYGIGLDYKVSKKVQLSLDILAEVDMHKRSKIIQEKTANIKVALSL